MRTVVAAALVALLACAGATSRTPAAHGGDADVFAGLGTWVDIYDGGVYAAPVRTAARIAARGVDTVWVETSNYGAAANIVRPDRLARFVDALHGLGIEVVAWYLPGHGNVGLDNRRALAMVSFRTPAGGAFDGVALDIESTKVKNVILRSSRAVALAERVKEAAPDLPLAIIPFNPRGLEKHPRTWPGFPWTKLASVADAFAPMIYTGGSSRGFDATYGYVTRALRLLRTDTGDPEVPIHVIGGVANRMGPDELAGFAAAVTDDGHTAGVSLYDWNTTGPAAWRMLSTLSG